MNARKARSRPSVERNLSNLDGITRLLYFAKKPSRPGASFCCAGTKVSGPVSGAISGTSPEESSRPVGASCGVECWARDPAEEPSDEEFKGTSIEWCWSGVWCCTVDDGGNFVIYLAEVNPMEVAPSSLGVSFSCEEIGGSGRIKANVGSLPDMTFLGDSRPGMAASSSETGALVEGSMVDRSSTPWSGIAGIVGDHEAPGLGMPIV